MDILADFDLVARAGLSFLFGPVFTTVFLITRFLTVFFTMAFLTILKGLRVVGLADFVEVAREDFMALTVIEPLIRLVFFAFATFSSTVLRPSVRLPIAPRQLAEPQRQTC